MKANWPVADGPELPQEAETSPNGRYIRYNMLLGKGACKRVYKALDTKEGTEVAWNQVDLLGMDRDEEARQHLHEEIRVLQKLKHKNIMTFYAWWYDPKNSHINFITELFTAGNLRQYRKKIKLMSENVLKRWAHQILEGLLYLHGHVPPIVHRDLKCDNIFVNSATGEIKIGDLGLATVQQQAMSVVGTPEFMAPEVYDETYDERCDIYSFGMCLLELATQEYPYSECHSVPQIFKKVTLGVPPASLARVGSHELRDFISLCIAHDPADRPSARELLKHPYLESVRSASSNGLTADASGHGGTAHSSVLASLSGGASGPGSGWNTPSGTLHCAASARDLREALHQQEALARLAAAQQQQQQQLQQQQSGLNLHGLQVQLYPPPHLSCPSGPSSPTAAAATAHAAAGAGVAAGGEGPVTSAGAAPRNRSSPTAPLGAAPPPLLLRVPSTAASMSTLPSQPSPLGRSSTAPPLSLGGGEATTGAPPLDTAALPGAGSAAAAAAPPPHRPPRSRLSGQSFSSGGSLPPSPMGRSQAPVLVPPWLSGSAPAAAEPAGAPDVRDAPQLSAAYGLQGSAEEAGTQQSAKAGRTSPPEGRPRSPPTGVHHADDALPPGGRRSPVAAANGPACAAVPPAAEAQAEQGRAGPPCDGSSTDHRTSSDSRRSSGCSNRSAASDSDEDEEILVPIDVLKAGLLAEGFEEEEEEECEECEGAGPSFSQTFVRPEDVLARTPRLPAVGDVQLARNPEAGFSDSQTSAFCEKQCQGLAAVAGPLFDAPSFGMDLDGGRCMQPFGTPDSDRGDVRSPRTAALAAEAAIAEVTGAANAAKAAVTAAAGAASPGGSAGSSATAVGVVLARGSSGGAAGCGHGSRGGSLDTISFHALEPLCASGANTPQLRPSYNGVAIAQVDSTASAAAPAHTAAQQPGRLGPQSGRPPLPPLPALPYCYSTPVPPGAAGGAAAGSVRLPSFRNKVVLAMLSGPHPAGADGAEAGAGSGPQTRCLRTTSAKAIGLGGRAGNGPLFCSPQPHGGRAHTVLAGAHSLRGPRRRDAVHGIPEELCSQPLPVVRDLAEGEGEAGAGYAGNCGGGGSFVPPRYDRSMSQPIGMTRDSISTDEHSRGGSLGGGIVAGGGNSAEHLAGNANDAASLTAGAPLPDGFCGAQAPPEELARRLSACGRSDTGDSGDLKSIAAAAAMTWSAGVDAVRDGNSSVAPLGPPPPPPEERLGVTCPLPPLHEEHSEQTPASARGSDSPCGGGAEAGVAGASADARMSPGAALLSLEAAGAVTVVREYARPIQGIIMRLKQWKRLVKDGARALRG